MKRIKAVLCVVTVLVFAAALAAQTPNADPAQAYPKEKQKATETTKKAATEKHKNITLTGCLQAGTDPNTFTLTNVGPGTGKAKGKQKEPASSTAATPASPAMDTYRLTAASGVDLKAHVGHKVTITGTMPIGTELARTEPGASTSGEKRVEVKTIKHVSPSCP
jgi:ABC-type uncharacterized transport system auxiliary subunit